MRFLRFFGLAGLVVAAGCGTVNLPTQAEVDGAVQTILHAAEQGVVTYYQIQAIKHAAKQAEQSMETEVAGTPCGEAGAAAPMIPAAQDTQVVIHGPSPDGRALVVVLGDRPACGYCTRLWVPGFEQSVEALLPGVDVVDADKNTAAGWYKTYRPTGGFSYPLARVYDAGGKLRGEFVARNMTAAAFAAKVREICPECVSPRWVAGDGVNTAHRTGAAVCVGLTRVDPARYGGWRGVCPGCDVDARVFADACRDHGLSTVTLLDEAATWENVLAAVETQADLLAPGGLLAVFVAGHGGQVAAGADESEADGMSETICLYDGPLVDDKVWELLQHARARGIRVWFVTDTCNSGTNYRAPYEYARGVDERTPFWRSEPDMLHWGGCADGESSYGTSQGGSFTTALVDSYAPGQSYAAWFAAARSRMGRGQTPVCEWTGRDFRHKEAFK